MFQWVMRYKLGIINAGGWDLNMVSILHKYSSTIPIAHALGPGLRHDVCFSFSWCLFVCNHIVFSHLVAMAKASAGVHTSRFIVKLQ
jgi:hypothetical protein